ncbi:MAG: threonine dehydratase [Desmonostoc vinosum HA7617-LM4]|jgi:hypothetical protein|nr:threonine dehydratase [Desmonostoc vinosum HA7617-LM4]
MFRLPPFIRNLFIRIEGFLSFVFGSIWGAIKSFFGFFGKLFGLSDSGYFLASDETQGVKQAQQPIETKQDTTPEIPATTRRRPNARTEDYYLNMARDLKKR